MKKLLLLVVFAVSSMGIQLSSQAADCAKYRNDKGMENYTGYACSSREGRKCRSYKNGQKVRNESPEKCAPKKSVRCLRYRNELPGDYTGFACSSRKNRDCREYQNGRVADKNAADWRCERSEPKLVNCKRFRNDMPGNYTGFACSSRKNRDCREYNNGRVVDSNAPTSLCERNESYRPPQQDPPTVIIVPPSTSPSDPSS